MLGRPVSTFARYWRPMQEHLRPLAPTRPQHPPPGGAVDCHAHIFGPLERFPVAEERSYDAVELPAERYLEMLDAIGLAGGVVVTASAYGTDNRALTHALTAFPGRLRARDIWCFARATNSL